MAERRDTIDALNLDLPSSEDFVIIGDQSVFSLNMLPYKIRKVPSRFFKSTPNLLSWISYEKAEDRAAKKKGFHHHGPSICFEDDDGTSRKGWHLSEGEKRFLSRKSKKKVPDFRKHKVKTVNGEGDGGASDYQIKNTTTNGKQKNKNITTKLQSDPKIEDSNEITKSYHKPNQSLKNTHVLENTLRAETMPKTKATYKNSNNHQNNISNFKKYNNKNVKNKTKKNKHNSKFNLLENENNSRIFATKGDIGRYLADAKRLEVQKEKERVKREEEELLNQRRLQRQKEKNKIDQDSFLHQQQLQQQQQHQPHYDSSQQQQPPMQPQISIIQPASLSQQPSHQSQPSPPQQQQYPLSQQQQQHQQLPPSQHSTPQQQQPQQLPSSQHSTPQQHSSQQQQQQQQQQCFQSEYQREYIWKRSELPYLPTHPLPTKTFHHTTSNLPVSEYTEKFHDFSKKLASENTHVSTHINNANNNHKNNSSDKNYESNNFDNNNEEMIRRREILQQCRRVLNKDDNTNKEGMNKENINKDNMNKAKINKDNINRDNINKDNINKDNVNKDNMKSEYQLKYLPPSHYHYTNDHWILDCDDDEGDGVNGGAYKRGLNGGYVGRGGAYGGSYGGGNDGGYEDYVNEADYNTLINGSSTHRGVAVCKHNENDAIVNNSHANINNVNNNSYNDYYKQEEGNLVIEDLEKTQGGDNNGEVNNGEVNNGEVNNGEVNNGDVNSGESVDNQRNVVNSEDDDGDDGRCVGVDDSSGGVLRENNSLGESYNNYDTKISTFNYPLHKEKEFPGSGSNNNIETCNFCKDNTRHNNYYNGNNNNTTHDTITHNNTTIHHNTTNNSSSQVDAWLQQVAELRKRANELKLLSFNGKFCRNHFAQPHTDESACYHGSYHGGCHGGCHGDGRGISEYITPQKHHTEGVVVGDRGTVPGDEGALLKHEDLCNDHLANDVALAF